MPESNLATIKGFVNAVANQDEDGQFSRMAPDAIITEPEALPYGGIWRGPEGWQQLSAQIFGTWEMSRNAGQLRIIGGEDDEYFALSMTLSGISRKTGKPFEMSLMELWHVVDGQIRSITPHYFDTLAAARINGDID